MIVFFDVDEITRTYLKEKGLIKRDTVLFENTIDTLSDSDFDKIKDATVISVFINSKVTKEVIDRFPSLKLIATRSTGFNHIDLDYCTKKNIVVENVLRYGEATVAEFALGLCLNLTRKMNVAYNDLKNGIVDIDRYMGRDMFESTIGIIGTGAIGKHAVKIALGLGMNVLAYDLYPSKDLIAYGVEYVDLDEMYSRADFISLHCPLTKDNEGFMNADAFAKMKDGVIIINTARGELINNEDLYKALKSGKVGGAGLDALAEESTIFGNDIYISNLNKFPQSELVTSFVNMKLLQLPNVIITPHIAFNSRDAVVRILATSVQNIDDFRKGKLSNVVNKELLAG